MSSRWFNIAVVLLWVSAMAWLITEKVLPPLLLGEPPKYANVLELGREEPRVPVAWGLFLENRPLGWASSDTVRQPDGLIEMRSRVHLDRFPLAEFAPGWLSAILEPLGDRDGELQIDSESIVEVLAGRLKGFRTKVDLGPLHDAILLNGETHGKKLKVHVRAGEFRYSTTTDLPGDAMLGDGLSPRDRLSELHVGQTWTEPVYSPFHQPNSPLQILQATVEREEPLHWNGGIVSTVVVVYRNDPGSEFTSSRTPRGRAWVRRDGVVLKQELQILGSRLVFVRLPQGKSPEDFTRSEAAPDRASITEPASSRKGRDIEADDGAGSAPGDGSIRGTANHP